MPNPVRTPEFADAGPALEVAAALGRRRTTIFGVFLVVTGIVAVGAWRTPLVYVAESSLLVRMGREYIYRPEIGRADSARTPSLSEIVNSEVEILASRDLAELVVVELGVDALYRDLLELGLDPAVTREMAVLRFRQATEVRPVLESSVIKVRFEHESSRVAAQAVNLLVERFKDKHVEVFGEESSVGLEDQLAGRRVELTHAEEALAEFKLTSGVSDLEEQRSILLGQRARLDDELRTCEHQLFELREPTGVEAGQPPAESTDASTALDPPTDRLIEEASVRKLELRLEEERLLRDYGPENRKVQGVRAELALVDGLLRRAQRQAFAFDEALRASLARELAALDQRIEDLDQHEKTLRQLERELTATESALQIIRERVEEARISEKLDRERRINVRVIEKAAAPVAPAGLSHAMKVALGACVGLVAGVAVAFLQELFRRN